MEPGEAFPIIMLPPKNPARIHRPPDVLLRHAGDGSGADTSQRTLVVCLTGRGLIGRAHPVAPFMLGAVKRVIGGAQDGRAGGTVFGEERNAQRKRDIRQRPSCI